MANSKDSILSKIDQRMDELFAAEFKRFFDDISSGKIPKSEIPVFLAKKPIAFQKRANALMFSLVTDSGVYTNTLTNAEKGDIQSQAALGDICSEQKKLQESHAWYLKAANNNSTTNPSHNEIRSRACYKLAINYRDGIGVDINVAEYVSFLKKAIDNDKKKLHLYVEFASCYINGYLNVPNEITSISKEIYLNWLKLTKNDDKQIATNPITKAEQTKIFIALGWAHFTGTTATIRDVNLAKKYFIKAVVDNDRLALVQLATVYFSLDYNTWVDAAEILDCCQRLAKHKFYAPLGVCYLKGFGVDKDPKKAFELLQKSKKKNDWKWTRIYELECQLEPNLEWPMSIDQVLNELEQIFDSQDHLRTQRASKMLHQYYHMTMTHLEKDILLLKKSVERKWNYAYVALADYYYHGIGVEQDPSKAIEFYNIAAKNNDPIALFRLGKCYLDGNSVVKKDAKKAVAYLLEAKKYGSVEANAALGYCYHHGEGISKNLKTAFELYQLAAKHDEPAALCYLGEWYKRGFDNGNIDVKRAVEYFKKAVQHGSIDAIHQLAHCYLFGMGCEQDTQKAFNLLNEHVSKHHNSHHLIQYLLGTCYEMGLGTDQNEEMAFKYYDLAAKDVCEARLLRARFWMEGLKPVTLDLNKAISEYRAIIDELKDFTSYYDKIFYHITLQEFNRVKAEALLNLGQCYWEKFDYKKAFECFEASQQLGNTTAQMLTHLFYKTGIGTEVNHERAQLLFDTLYNKSFADPRINFKLWVKQKEENEKQFTLFILFPNKFQTLQDLNGNSLYYLKTRINYLATKINDFKYPIEHENISKLNKTENSTTMDAANVERIRSESINSLQKAEAIVQKIMEKYTFYKNEINRIFIAHNESIAKFNDLLDNEIKAYEKYLEHVKSNIVQLTKIVDDQQSLAEQLSKESPKIDKNNKTKDNSSVSSMSPKSQISSITSASSMSEVNSEEKAYQEKRNSERENWKKMTAQYQKDFLEKQKKEHDKKISREVEKEITYWFEYNKGVNKKARRPVEPSARLLAKDWQIPLRLRFKEELDLLNTVTNFIEQINANAPSIDLNNKLTLEDLWIERELYINLLGRLMEVVKKFKGSERKIPVDVASGIRNVLLKYPYFGHIRFENVSSNTEMFTKAQATNKALQLTIQKLLSFFKEEKTNLAFDVKSYSLLDEIYTHSKNKAFMNQTWTLEECIDRVKQEEQNLTRLEIYQGIYQSEDSYKIVKAACHARWGTVSSYVKAHANELFPNAIIDMTLYDYLVKEDYITLGNEFRHSEKAINIATAKSDSVAKKSSSSKIQINF